MADAIDVHPNAPAGGGGPGAFVGAGPTGNNSPIDKWKAPGPLGMQPPVVGGANQAAPQGGSTQSAAAGIAPSVQRQQLVNVAMHAAKDAAGKSYTPNGRTTAGFDCSGFVTYVYGKVFPGYTHMNTDAIESSPLYKKVASPQPGDLIFFPKGVNPYDMKAYPNHVGIVLDSGTWIGSQTTSGVKTVTLTNPWWRSREKFFLRYSVSP